MQASHVAEPSFGKLFFKYVSLSTISMVGVSLCILADTFFIANGVGPKGLAALNVVVPLFSALNGIGLMFGMGGATLYAIAQGKEESEKGNKIFSFTMASSLILGVVLTALCLLFADPILKILGAGESIFALSKEYYMILIGCSSFFIISNALTCFIRNDHNPNLAMNAMLLGSLLNIVLDYFFIFPLNMGMRGAALGTVLSPLASLLLLSIHWRSKKRQLQFLSFNWSFGELKDILSIGFPSFITEFSSGVVIFLFNKIILDLSGNAGVAAYSIIANIAYVGVAIFTGIGQGIQPLASLSFSKKDKKSILNVLIWGMVLSFGIGALFYGISLFYAEPIIQLFNNENSQELAQITKTGFSLYFISFLFVGLNITAISLFSAVARPRQSLILSLLRGLILITPVLFVLANLFGMTGVWIAMPLTEASMLFITFYFLHHYFHYLDRHFI